MGGTMSDVLILIGLIMFATGILVGAITSIVFIIKKRKNIRKPVLIWVICLLLSFLIMYAGANLPEQKEEFSNEDVLEEELSQEEIDEESNSITLKEENYVLSYGSVSLSVTQNKKNERTLYITARFDEDWQAAGFYMYLTLFYKQWDGEDNGLNLFFLVNGNKSYLTPIACLYDSQPVNGAEWAVNQISTERYDSEVIELIWDEFETNLMEFASEE